MQNSAMEMKADKVHEATAFLKTLANQNRLMALCHLAEGERSVGELELLLGIRQANLSQQLARLRADGLVKTRRDSKSIYYSLDSPEVVSVIQLLYRLFCAADASANIAPGRDIPAAAE
jgi:ArsR family transcriptional regulator